jgi:hypothetical protein
MENTAKTLFVTELSKTKNAIRNMVVAIILCILLVSFYKKNSFIDISKRNQSTVVTSPKK